ncbi:MAG: cytochrome [Geobacteraceae bacterium]|nr:MAG: cytochrome [Geobacteraceae bacterium]
MIKYMNVPKLRFLLSGSMTMLLFAAFSALAAESSLTDIPAVASVTFPKGTATPSEECGACHKAIYREFAFGFGSDIRSRAKPPKSPQEQGLNLPSNVSATATAHAVAGVDPFPIHTREAEAEGRSCNVCHFPEAFAIPDMEISEVFTPKPRPKGEETGGLTCASCHLTPEGKIRGPYNLRAPHDNFPDAQIKTSLMCAYCHSLGKRVAGKQTQTFLEWRDDFWKQGLGSQNCQDCHMPRTLRKLAEDYNVPERVAARHLWTGGRSLQRLQNALSQVIIQPAAGKSDFEIHLINIGAGHSVPTGSNRRAVYLEVQAKDQKGKSVVRKEWMFAPWYSARPDDRKHLEEDRQRPDAKAAMQADAQGPHEPIIRAGEERVLTWSPTLKPGSYTIQARLVYDLNRYNDRFITTDQTVFNTTTLAVQVRR